MSSILKNIIEYKKLEVKKLHRQFSVDAFYDLIEEQEVCRGFAAAIEDKVQNKKSAVIAECKKASPSQGVILEEYNASKIALEYQEAGATCISVLTDGSFFQGKIEDLQEVKARVQLPVIRKDFMIDPLQIFQSRAIGADCVLLIVSALGTQQLDELYHCATELGIDVFVETHNMMEVEIACQMSPRLLGINNRNLKTFEVDLQTTIQSINFIPKAITVVTESGIKTPQDVQLMYDNEIYAFLVGESLMRQPSPGMALKSLFSL